MSYALNKTDGSLLLTLVDGSIDNTTTGLTFIGRNYQGYGEAFNENFIKLLENFANTSAPGNPIVGQVWFDTGSGRLKVYDGATFRTTDNKALTAQAPIERVEGDIWIDSGTKQMYFWDGSDWSLIGPHYEATQGINGWVTRTIRDRTGQNKIVNELQIGGNRVAIFSADQFTPLTPISGFGEIKQGINLSESYTNFQFFGTATSARQIVDSLGNVYNVDDFVSATGDTITGTLYITPPQGNNIPLVLGSNEDLRINVNSTDSTIQNIRTDATFKIKAKSSIDGEYNVITAVPQEDYVVKPSPRPDYTRLLGINVEQPEAALHVVSTDPTPSFGNDSNGDPYMGLPALKLTGDLVVDGNVKFISASESVQQRLVINDKQIELARPDDSTILSRTDPDLDEAGIVILAQEGDINWYWKQSTSSWTTNENIEITANLGKYRINGTDILSIDTLGSTVVNSGLTTVGQLENLTVGSSSQSQTLSFTEDSITATNDLSFAVAGNISFGGKVLSGVNDPNNSTDAANKQYVDQSINEADTFISADITGLDFILPAAQGGNVTDPDQVVQLLDILIPATTAPLNKTVKIIGTLLDNYLLGTTINPDPTGIYAGNLENLEASFNINPVAVDSGGTQNVSVVGSFNVADTITYTTPGVTRYIFTYQKVNDPINGELWRWQATDEFIPT